MKSIQIIEYLTIGTITFVQDCISVVFINWITIGVWKILKFGLWYFFFGAISVLMFVKDCLTGWCWINACFTTYTSYYGSINCTKRLEEELKRQPPIVGNDALFRRQADRRINKLKSEKNE